MSYWANLESMSVSVIISREGQKAVGLNQGNNSQTERGPGKVIVSQMTLHQETHSESHPWIKYVLEPVPQAHGWANLTLQCTPLFPCLPSPSYSSRPRDLCQESLDLSHQHPLQHHSEHFDFSIDISKHPTCLHFSCSTWCGEYASTNLLDRKKKNLQREKTKCLHILQLYVE